MVSQNSFSPTFFSLLAPSVDWSAKTYLYFSLCVCVCVPSCISICIFHHPTPVDWSAKTDSLLFDLSFSLPFFTPPTFFCPFTVDCSEGKQVTKSDQVYWNLFHPLSLFVAIMTQNRCFFTQCGL